MRKMKALGCQRVPTNRRLKSIKNKDKEHYLISKQKWILYSLSVNLEATKINISLKRLRGYLCHKIISLQ